MGKLIPQSRHRVMCGDSTDPKSISALMNGELADLFLTDPPYNVSYSGGALSTENRTIQNDDMEDKEFREFLRSAFSAAHDVSPSLTHYFIIRLKPTNYGVDFFGVALQMCNFVFFMFRRSSFSPHLGAY